MSHRQPIKERHSVDVEHYLLFKIKTSWYAQKANLIILCGRKYTETLAGFPPRGKQGSGHPLVSQLEPKMWRHVRFVFPNLSGSFTLPRTFLWKCARLVQYTLVIQAPHFYIGTTGKSGAPSLCNVAQRYAHWGVQPECVSSEGKRIPHPWQKILH